ncbi:MAG: hypothetical protein GX316_04020 [Firmicutes bacterium]|nr:hypothetical protein [Bacillota bacterium]
MQMRRKLLIKSGILMVVVLLLGVQGVLGAEVKVVDVPQSHWAYQGVMKLVEEGYLGVFEDGTFQGERSVDRYTLASVVGTMLLEIEKGQLGITQADIELLRKLSTEFRDELVRWYDESEKLRTATDDVQKRMQVMDNTITRVIDTMEQEDADIRSELQNQVGLILDEIAQTRADLSAVDLTIMEEIAASKGRLASLEETLVTHRAEMEETETALAETQAYLDETRASVKENTFILEKYSDLMALQGESLTALEEAVGVKVQSRFAESEVALRLLQDELIAQNEELETELRLLEDDVAETAVQLSEVESKLADWQKASVQREETLLSQIHALETGVNELNQVLLAETTDTSEGVEELRKQLARQAEAVASADGQLMRDLEALRHDLVRSMEAVQVDLMNIGERIITLDKRTAILRQETDAETENLAKLKEHFDGLEAEFLQVRSRLGDTEERLITVEDRVVTQSSSQLSASLMREKRLERQLQELQDEFDSYRNQADKERKSLKGASNIAAIAAVVALIVAVVAGGS